MVKHLPTLWETGVRSLGWEDPLEKEMTTHSSTLAWKIPWTEESKPGYNAPLEMVSAIMLLKEQNYCYQAREVRIEKITNEF